ncbi:common pilus major fimbrillin subunit EcpA [Solimicrobium silvestre]|uniref:Common pilus major fimbrillin subunit EcpA n=1 Tax=Solimicrobium silvestre TaxID=2099400 RepID=A0A2S9GUS3_9BURK|nr:common pilus major fimbrillin subunit EcpA [Solimicrobium silvestre]PRC91448.1 hypothetical protein S2091_3863 [Solimicrobium silvestre]
MKNLVKLSVLGVLVAASFSASASGEVTTANTSVKWNAEAVKKSDVELNVFASNDALQFKWDVTNKRFSNASSSLTIQAAGKPNSTAYSITSQLLRKKLTHLSGAGTGTLSLGATLGGLAMTDKPVSILAGNDFDMTASAAGMQAMNLSKAGPNTTPKGSYHEANNVMVDFRIEEGTDSAGKELTLGSDDKGLDMLADGVYEGQVELAFVASWTAGYSSKPSEPDEL